MSELNLNNNPIKTNIYGKPMNVIDNRPNNNTNNNINNAPNINMNNNNYGQDNQILNNPYQIKHEPVFDEIKSKQSLIKLLKKDLYQKINYAVQPITTSYLKLEKIKENIHQKFFFTFL